MTTNHKKHVIIYKEGGNDVGILPVERPQMAAADKAREKILTWSEGDQV